MTRRDVRRCALSPLSIVEQPEPFRLTLDGGFESLEEGEQFCITREGSSVQGVKLGRSLSSGGSPVPSASPTASPPRLQTPRGLCGHRRGWSSGGSSASDSACASPVSTEPQQPPLVALSDLRVCGILGRGATAAVSLAQHVSGQMVALKLIPLDCREAARARLLAELRCTHAAADCASVVALHAAFLVDGCVAVVLEYMDRGSLADVLLRVGSLPEPALAAVAGAVCAGLVHLHDSLRILHRDVKPGNVLLDSTGRVKLSDFGVSGSMEADSTSSSWLGTARYMAPERIGGGRYGAASDVWALGLTLLEAATGRCPFASAAGSDFWTVLDEVTSSPPPRLPNDGRFTPGFRDFVSRCLEADPAMRPTAAQLLDHPWLRSATAGGAAEAALVGVVAGLPPAGGLPTLPE